MKKHEFYQKYADTPISERFTYLTLAYNSSIFRMTLNNIYDELSNIDKKLLDDEIRREQLLKEVEKFFKTPAK